MALIKELFKIPSLPKTIRDRIQTNIIWWYNKILKRSRIERRTFIVGCGHSGTSLLLAILGSHPRIFAVPYESGLFKKSVRRVKFILKKFDNNMISLGKKHWMEKTPKHIYYIENILKLVPNARIVLIIRDGRDVALSIKARTNNFEEGVKRWVKDNKAGQQFWDHPQLLKIKYEDIIEDFKKTISLILNFIGETYESDVEQFYKKPKKYYSEVISKAESVYGKNHDQYRNWQINQKLFDGRKRWKREMSEEEKTIFNNIAGPMLNEYGYTKDNEW